MIKLHRLVTSNLFTLVTIAQTQTPHPNISSLVFKECTFNEKNESYTNEYSFTYRKLLLHLLLEYLFRNI